MENIDLDVFLKEFIHKYYRRMVVAFKTRMEKANDKEYTLSLYRKRMGGMTDFRLEINEDYKTIIEHFEGDYKLGRPFKGSLKTLRRMHSFYYHEDTILPEFVQRSDEEIARVFGEYIAFQKFKQYLNDIGTAETMNSNKENTDDPQARNKGFTTARQVLTVHYLLKYCQVKNIDNTEKARFIHFLTGKNYDNIYKRVQSPLNGSDKYINEDLKYVRRYFEQLGMKEVVKMINNELEQSA